MEFVVRFESERYAVALEAGYNVGIRQIDQVRRELNYDLPLECIDGCVDAVFTYWVEVPISEEMARRAGHFLNTSKVTVDVTPNSLNGDYELTPVVERNPDTGEILRVSFQWKLNGEFLVKQWEAAGFPLEWDPMTEPEDMPQSS